MSTKLGFAILSYDQPEFLLRLVKTLNRMFGDPPIVCHHNFSQCSLDEALFPTNVRFVHPHIATRWGHISCPLAVLRAFGLLRADDRPDWFFLLSGSDYPVRPANEIIADLSNPKFDAYLDHREILSGAPPPGQTAQDGGFGRPDWIPIAYYRYCRCRYPAKAALLPGSSSCCRRFVPIKSHRLDRMARWFQFNRPSRIYGGCFWFHANRRAIDRLLDDPSMRRLVRYYRIREIPEESLFHTALCNQVGLQIGKEHKRYEDWTGGGAHPKWLDMSDVTKIIASGAYFARKIRDPGVVEFFETTVLGAGSVAHASESPRFTS
jgi:Core-2/I-Branching enzyme